MSLIFWTGAKQDLIEITIGKSLKSFRPNIPAHQFWPCEEELENVPVPEAGDVVLVCGNRPLEQLRKTGVVHKNRSVNSLRENPIKYGAGHYLVTFDPGMTQLDYGTKPLLDWDVRLAHRLMTTGSLVPQVGHYEWVNTLGPMMDFIDVKFAKTGKAVDVTVDTETMGLYPWYPDKDIVSISFTVEPGKSSLLYLHPSKQPVPPLPAGALSLFEQVQWLLTSPKVKLRGANLKFDLIWIREKWGIECTNFKFDTLLVGSILDENRSNSLNLHAKVYTSMGGYDDPFNATHDKSHMEKAPLHDLLTYAGGDTDAAHQVADTLREELAEDEKLTRFYVRILHPAARAFEKIERRGIHVDQHKMHLLREELKKVIKESTDRQLSLLPNTMRIKYRDRIEEQIAAGKNPMLPSIVKEYFFSPKGLNLNPKELTEKTKEPSLTKSHLRQFADNPHAAQMVAAMTEGDSASKTLSTFVEGFLKHLRPDGLFHPTFMLYKGDFNDEVGDESGTNTGRLSAKDPAIQTLPKKTKWAKKLRECFPAPKGKVVFSVDYSQGELKVVACVAPEKTMIVAYEQGLDLHAVTGAKLAGVDLKEFLSWKDCSDTALAALFDKHRGDAKPANFGLLYGMSAEGFQAYAWAAYGVKLTLGEAEKMRNAFFELYPGLLDYHDHQREIVRIAQQVRSPLGRLRHLPMIRSRDRSVRNKAERQAINSPIQSCLNDMMLWAVAEIEAAFPNGEVETVATIHDAAVGYLPETNHEYYARQITEIMANLPLHEIGWHPQLKFTADAEAGPDLAHMSKLKFAA